MTFKNIQDRVMERLDLTSSESRSRIKNFINERYRRLQTSINLGRVRRTTMTFATVNGTRAYTPSNVIKILAITYPAGNRVLWEASPDQVRNLDPDSSRTGAPEGYNVTLFGATGVTVEIYPLPDAAYTLQVDGLLRGTDLSGDGDLPAFPEDFHDSLVFGAAADELEHLEKPEKALQMEQRYELRMRDLRFFLNKSSYLYQQQNDNWWMGPWPNGYFGWQGW